VIGRLPGNGQPDRRALGCCLTGSRCWPQTASLTAWPDQPTAQARGITS
jgi:hypothetical protein